jgi:hypothetical protein
MIAIRITPKSIFFNMLMLAIIFTAGSCARKISFLNSVAVPAAGDTVQVKKDNNHNYVIRLQLSNLAEVERLQPGKQIYVVWMITSNSKLKT